MSMALGLGVWLLGVPPPKQKLTTYMEVVMVGQKDKAQALRELAKNMYTWMTLEAGLVVKKDSKPSVLLTTPQHLLLKPNLTPQHLLLEMSLALQHLPQEVNLNLQRLLLKMNVAPRHLYLTVNLAPQHLQLV